MKEIPWCGECNLHKNICKCNEPDSPSLPVDKIVSHRISNYGFYCGECRKFTYTGYDKRDKVGLPNGGSAVCLNCGDNYDKE